MSVRSAQSITTEFTTRVFATGVATNADSTPTGTLYVNGTADAASVTVTNQAAGKYKAAVTLPTLAIGDVVSLVIAATVSTISDNAKVWEDTCDLSLDSSGRIDIGKALGTAVTLDANNVLNVSTKYWAGTAITATSIPVATAAGASGGLLISGSNAGTTTFGALTVTGAMTVTGGMVANITGNVSGSIGSVTNKVTVIDIDGITHASVMEMLLSAATGVATPNGSTTTFFKRDGLTSKFSLTYGGIAGKRTNSAILS